MHVSAEALFTQTHIIEGLQGNPFPGAQDPHYQVSAGLGHSGF